MSDDQSKKLAGEIGTSAKIVGEGEIHENINSVSWERRKGKQGGKTPRSIHRRKDQKVKSRES